MYNAEEKQLHFDARKLLSNIIVLWLRFGNFIIKYQNTEVKNQIISTRLSKTICSPQGLINSLERRMYKRNHKKTGR
jgi:hypothetical protein